MEYHDDLTDFVPPTPHDLPLLGDSKEESSKKQKLEEDNDAEKEELRDNMDVVPMDDVAIDVESLATKYPICMISIITSTSYNESRIDQEKRRKMKVLERERRE
ncbi:hypothetical protein Tco_0353841, partial [Tanacetum coccineum]